MIFVQYVFPSLSLSISFASSSIFQRARFSKMENWVLFCIVRVLARHTAAAAEEKNFGSRINAACCWCLCIIICNLLSGKCFHHILFKYNTNIYLKLYLELNWMMKKLPWLVRITSHSSAPIWPLFVLLKLHSRQSAYAHVQSIILKSTWTWSNVFFGLEVNTVYARLSWNVSWRTTKLIWRSRKRFVFVLPPCSGLECMLLL